MGMKTIYSTDNKIYKLCKELTTKKYRDRLGKYLIEGENLVEEAEKSGVSMEYLIFREDYEGAALSKASSAREAARMSRALFSEIAQTETSQGVLAVAAAPALPPEAFYAACGEKNIVVLDRLQDPGNIGTIIRTAEAAGYGGIVTIKGTGDVYSPKTVRAAAGSVFRMPVLQAAEAEDVARRIKESGRHLVATAMDGAALYSETDLCEKTALIIGNEGNGISEEMFALADLKVRLPMRGAVESLNAAVAAAILMYENVRKES